MLNHTPLSCTRFCAVCRSRPTRSGIAKSTTGVAGVVGAVVAGGAMACGSSAGVVGATALGVLAELLVATDELAAGSFSSPSTALLIAPRTRSPPTTSTHGRFWNGFFAGGPACGYGVAAPN